MTPMIDADRLEWVEYAVSRGWDRHDVEALSKVDIIGCMAVDLPSSYDAEWVR